LNFEHPVFLIGLVPLAPALVLAARPRWRGVARTAAICALVAALARPGTTRTVETRGAVAGARDASASVRPGELDAAPPGEPFLDPVAAVARAAALAGDGGAVILATDARWDPATAAAVEAEAARAPVPVFAWLPPPGLPDAAAESVFLAAAARAGERAEIGAVVRGLEGSRGEALLLVDDVPAGRAPWAGPMTRLRFPVTLEAGFRRFTLRLEPRTDGDARNNVALGGAEVAGAPYVLVVEGAAGAGGEVARALEAQGIRVTVRRAGEAPAWDDAAAVVLARVDASRLPGAAVLAAAVERGGGLLAIVGPEDAGSWAGSPLARLLPLTLRPPDPGVDAPPEDPPPATGDPAPAEEAPRVLLVMVVDRSGSMHGEKLSAAKEAAIASAAALDPEDLVALVAFDAEPHWIVEPSPAGGREAIRERVSRLAAEGETDVHRALESVEKKISPLRVPVRHVIVLSDGITPAADFRDLVERMARVGITVSSVGLGNDFDGTLMANIASWGGGRFYFTERPGEVPRIFTTEARRAAAGAPPRPTRAPPKPVPPPPVPKALEVLPVLAGAPDPATDGFETWPEVRGACGAEPAESSRVLLHAGARPLLASRRAGLGRVAAFAAPLDGERARTWASWDPFPRFAAQLLRALMRTEEPGPSVEIGEEGDRGRAGRARDPRRRPARSRRVRRRIPHRSRRRALLARLPAARRSHRKRAHQRRRLLELAPRTRPERRRHARPSCSHPRSSRRAPPCPPHRANRPSRVVPRGRRRRRPPRSLAPPRRAVENHPMIEFDFTNATRARIGPHGLSDADWAAALADGRPAFDAVEQDAAAGRLGFRRLPFADPKPVADYARAQAPLFDNLAVLGIGGSALGTTALSSALLHPWWNYADSQARRAPRLFVLDNVDPEEIAGHLEVCLPERTLYNVISKSGETAETTAQLCIFADALRRRLGERWRDHVVVTTDPEKGFLRRLAQRESLASFPVPADTGGRFSALTAVSLLPMALCGVDPSRLLAGARAAEERGREAAFQAACLYTAFYRRGRSIAVMMPYSRALRDVADWFRQLWAESLGKRKSLDGRDVYEGQTPVKALGATDQHSQAQLYNEGPNDKLVAFLEVAGFRRECPVPPAFEGDTANFLAGRDIGELLNAEKKGTERALTAAGRPNVTFRLQGVTPETAGALLHFFELMTAYAGRLWNVNAFDQPGVEAGKHATFALMGRKGYEKLAEEIRAGEPADGQRKTVSF
jgi:glucose-6-phosphate isomerase